MAERPDSVQQQSPEYRAFVKCTGALVAMVQSQAMEFSDELFGESYISKDVREKTLLETITDSDKARKMLASVLDMIELNPNVFRGFMEMDLLAEDSKSKLQEAYKLEVQEQATADDDSDEEEWFDASSEVHVSDGEDQFPYLDTRGLTANETLVLKSQLVYETQQMEHYFYKFSVSVRKSLSANTSVSLEDVRELVLSQGEIDEVHKLKIEQASSIIKITNALRTHNYITFFHYYIIENLVEVFGSDEDHKELGVYLKKLEEFCKRSVFQVPSSALNCKARSSDKTLVLKCTEKVVSLNRVREIMRKLVETFINVEQSDFRICTIKEGCVELHFLVSAAVAERVFPVFPSQHKALSEIGVRVIDNDADAVWDDLGTSTRVCRKQTEFDLLLVEIVNSLTTDEQRTLVIVHRGPKSGNVEGLKSILKQLNRGDLVEKCEEYEIASQEERKSATQQETAERRLRHNADQMSIQLKQQIRALIDKGIEANNIYEQKVKKYRNAEITEVEVQETYELLKNTLETSIENIKTVTHSISESKVSPQDQHEIRALKKWLLDEEPPCIVTDSPSEDITGSRESSAFGSRGDSAFGSRVDSAFGSSDGSREQLLKDSQHADSSKRELKPQQIPDAKHSLPKRSPLPPRARSLTIDLYTRHEKK